MRVTAWDAARSAPGWERWWREPGQLVAKQHRAGRVSFAGGAVSERCASRHGLHGQAGDCLIVVFAFNCNAIWKDCVCCPQDIPGAGVPTGPTALFSLSVAAQL